MTNKVSFELDRDEELELRDDSAYLKLSFSFSNTSFFF